MKFDKWVPNFLYIYKTNNMFGFSSHFLIRIFFPLGLLQAITGIAKLLSGTI